MKRFNFKNLRINAKLILLILSTALIIFAGVISYITFSSRSVTLNYSKQITQKLTKEYANQIASELNIDVGICRAMGTLLENYYKIDSLDLRQEIYDDLMLKTIEENPQYVSVWLNWELSAIDEDYTKDFGRDRTTYFRNNNKIERKREKLDLNGDDKTGLYYQVKQDKREFITNPYFDSYTKKKEDEVLVTSICIPIIRNNDFVGIVGVDVLLERYQSMIENLNPFENSYAFMVANNGKFVAHAKKELVNKSMLEFIKDPVQKERFRRQIAEGTEVTYVRQGDDGYSTFVAYAPIVIGESKEPWSVALTVPVSKIMLQADKSLRISIFAGILGLILLTFIIWLIARSISKPIVKTTNSLIKLSTDGVGYSTKMLEVSSNDEIGKMNEALNNLILSLRNTSGFAKQIGEGNLDIDFKPLGDDDLLGKSLIEMRASLKKAREDEEVRKEEDAKRYWINNGLNKFSEILRKDHENIEQLAYNLILNLVKYLEATQGGIFVKNEENVDDVFLELAACYAFDRQKFISREVREGEGLVGTCYLEKKTIYLEEIPDNYITISSGLGQAQPKALLLVPLTLNEEIFGIVEIASLKPLEEYKIDFVKQVGESVASVISSVKTNIKTAELLQQSQQQSEEMKAQEEEMRQNMEELHATQEEMTRKNAEIEGVMNGIHNSLAILELNMDGVIESGNFNFYRITGLTYADVHNKSLDSFISPEFLNDGTYDELWRHLKEGETHSVVFEYNLPNKKLWTRETYAPIQTSLGFADKIMGFIIDITDQKELELENQTQLEEAKVKEEELRTNMEELGEAQQEMTKNQMKVKALNDALNNTAYITEYDVDGKVIEINDFYLKKIKASREEIIGQHILFGSGLNDKQKNELKKVWLSVIKGEVKENFISQYKAEDGKPFFVRETFTPVLGTEGEVVKVVKIGIDITAQVNAEYKLKKQQGK